MAGLRDDYWNPKHELGGSNVRLTLTLPHETNNRRMFKTVMKNVFYTFFIGLMYLNLASLAGHWVRANLTPDEQQFRIPVKKLSFISSILNFPGSFFPGHAAFGDKLARIISIDTSNFDPAWKGFYASTFPAVDESEQRQFIRPNVQLAPYHGQSMLESNPPRPL